MAGRAPSLRRAPLLYSLMPLFKLLFVALVQATPIDLYDGSFQSTGSMLRKHKDASDGETEVSMVLYLSVAAALVLLGGAFAGLTIALMGQDEIYLQVIAESGEDHERRSAQRVLDLLQKGKHWVLVTLLLGNVITNESLPIMLDRSLGGGWQAVVGSTVLIVIFGEIVPQSVCVRFGLPIGSFMAPLVLGLMWILAPVAWPTAKLLDFLLGQDHGTTYKKAGLKTLVTLHRTLNTSGEDRLNKDEVTIISAVLDLKEKPVGSIMTPMEDVFTLSADTILDEDMMDNILSEGYSRIPIYAVDDSNNFIGMLLVKMLITYDPEDCMRVDDFQLATLPETRPETSCLDIVNFFQEGKSHMVLVSESPGEPLGALGVLTLEDVIEELIGEEIIDESDVFVDVHKAIRRLNPVPWFRIPKVTLEEDKGDDGIKPESTLLTKQDRKPSLSDPPTRTNAKLLRRRSSGAAETLSVNRQDPELKNHLKHLGPSNVASRPKMTKINTVKIKPGQAKGIPITPSRYAASDGGRLENVRTGSLVSESNLDGHVSNVDVTEPVVIVDDGDGESTRLLSAGSAAKDGAHIVGYGTLTSSATSKTKNLPEQIRKLSSAALSPLREAQTPSTILEPKEDEQADPTPTTPKQEPERNPEENPRAKPSPSSSSTNRNSRSSISQPSSSPLFRTQESVSTPTFPAKLVISSEAQPDAATDDEEQGEDENSSGASQVASMRSAGTGGTSRRIARSGSIMERGIDVNGVPKMVLQVNEDEGHSADDGEGYRHPRHGSNENEALLGTVEESEPAGSGKRVKKRKKRGGKGKGKNNKKSVASPEASDGVHLA